MTEKMTNPGHFILVIFLFELYTVFTVMREKICSDMNRLSEINSNNS